MVKTKKKVHPVLILLAVVGIILLGNTALQSIYINDGFTLIGSSDSLTSLTSTGTNIQDTEFLKLHLTSGEAAMSTSNSYYPYKLFYDLDNNGYIGLSGVDTSFKTSVICIDKGGGYCDARVGEVIFKEDLLGKNFKVDLDSYGFEDSIIHLILTDSPDITPFSYNLNNYIVIASYMYKRDYVTSVPVYEYEYFNGLIQTVQVSGQDSVVVSFAGVGQTEYDISGWSGLYLRAILFADGGSDKVGARVIANFDNPRFIPTCPNCETYDSNSGQCVCTIYCDPTYYVTDYSSCSCLPKDISRSSSLPTPSMTLGVGESDTFSTGWMDISGLDNEKPFSIKYYVTGTSTDGIVYKVYDFKNEIGFSLDLG